ncbi:MAG: Spy/CpxP family protein refolding chaperone [Hyphomicrobiales bacterium]|nr:Spy/CpxP family protein refolding chaperone [Hyphomicrobiales bacterium]
MTENENMNNAPEANKAKPSAVRRWGKRLAIGAVLVGLGAAAGGALGVNAVKAHFMRGFDVHSMSTEQISERVDRRVERMLSRLDGTTDEQQRQISTIAKSAIGDLKALEFAPREIRGKFVEVLSADNFDAVALETLRAEQVAKFDTASKRMVEAVSEVAGVLTVEQRKQLVEKMAKRGGRRGHHGDRGGTR